MKQKAEIILSSFVVLTVVGFLVALWFGRDDEPRTVRVVSEDGMLTARSDEFVTSRTGEVRESNISEKFSDEFDRPVEKNEEVAEGNDDQENESVQIAHGTQNDVEKGFGIETFIAKWRAQAEKDKEDEEDRDEDKEDRDEDEVNNKRLYVGRVIGTGRTEPFYPRDEDDTVNREARSLLIQAVANAARSGSFGQIQIPVTGRDVPTVPPKRVSITADDAHQKRMLDEMKSLQIWGGSHKFIFSEMGVTNNDDDTRYANLARKFFEAANVMGYSSMAWAMGDWWGNYGGSLSSNGTIPTSGVGAPFVQNQSTNLYVRGVNLAGGEFGMNPDAVGRIGAIDDTYTYHIGSKLWKALKDRGFTHARLPFRFERLFNNDGSFNAADKALFMRAIAEARSNNIKLLLDPHNYAAMQINGRKEVLGEGAFSVSLFNKMMRNLGQLGAQNADVIDMIGLMNEPKNLAPSKWEKYAQSSLNAVRAGGFKGVIEVPTGNWQGIQDVPRIHSGGPWINDPQNNFMYGVHQYYDVNHSGHYQSSYSADEAELRKDYKPGSVTVWKYGNASSGATYEDYPCPPESDHDGDGWGWDGQKGCRVN